jgi:putative flippase GtrA
VLEKSRPRSAGWTTLRVVVNDRRIRYLFAGGVAAAVYYVVFAIAWLEVSAYVHYEVVVVAANALTVVSTYPLYRRFVFQSAIRWISGFPKFYLTSLTGLFIALAGLPLLVEIGHVPVLIAQAIVIVAVPLLNYQVHRFWTFRHPPAASAES